MCEGKENKIQRVVKRNNEGEKELGIIRQEEEEKEEVK